MHDLADSRLAAVYANRLTRWYAVRRLMPDLPAEPGFAAPADPALQVLGRHRGLMLLDFLAYLPEDILTKTDRASMAVSLETRAPLLDPALVELCWRLPTGFDRRGRDNKWPLKQVIARYLDPALIDRPKQGFGAPVKRWLAGPLRDWAESLLSVEALHRSGMFEPAPARRLWRAYLGGRNYLHPNLWNLLMFQAWADSTHRH